MSDWLKCLLGFHAWKQGETGYFLTISVPGYSHAATHPQTEWTCERCFKETITWEGETPK